MDECGIEQPKQPSRYKLAVRKFRRHHGITQYELATKLGFDTQITLSKYESGVLNPSFYLVVQILEAYPETPEDLARDLLLSVIEIAQGVYRFPYTTKSFEECLTLLNNMGFKI